MTPEPVLRRDATAEDVDDGAYIAGEAPGAYPNGTRILKVEGESGDGTPVGTGGIVLSSVDTSHISIPGVRKATYFYFVLFDDFPAPIGIADWKIGKEGLL